MSIQSWAFKGEVNNGYAVTDCGMICPIMFKIHQGPNVGDTTPTSDVCVNPCDVFVGDGCNVLAGISGFNAGRRRSSARSIRNEILVRSI